jgi:hypothetical protein
VLLTGSGGQAGDLGGKALGLQGRRRPPGVGADFLQLKGYGRVCHEEGEAEVGVPVRGLALGRAGGDLVQVDVERDAIKAGRADCLLPGDGGLLGELTQRGGEQPGVGCVEMPAGQQPAVQALWWIMRILPAVLMTAAPQVTCPGVADLAVTSVPAARLDSSGARLSRSPG